MKPQKVYVRGPTVRAVLDDDFPLTGLGKPEVHRATHVEPVFDADAGRIGWWFSPTGHTPGATPVSTGPYETRATALEAEREWVNANLAANKE